MTDQQTVEGAVEARAPFVIDSADKAAWAVDKVLGARARLERVRAACDAAIREAEREVADTEGFFLPQLRVWAEQNPPAKGKTIRLTTGALAFRAVPGGPRVVDSVAALEWARQHLPAAVKVSESLSATAVKSYVTQTGDLPPGVEVVEGREAFDVKVS